MDIVIGLGKREGASQHHRWGVRGLREMLPETAKVVVEKTPFVGGLAVLENAAEQTARLQLVDRDELFEVEPRLLEEARGRANPPTLTSTTRTSRSFKTPRR